MKHITRTVWILSVVSLFQDVSSEMLYPVLPLYLSSIGFSIALIGVLEGFAEATIGLSKGYFGKLSDITGKRVPFVQWGYALSTVGKTLMVLIAHPVWVFITRTMDRLGKGVRTSARDAMLSDETSKETKGRVFGFHRAMDTLGAALGPIIALIYLYYYPENYKTLFFLAFIPGVIAVLFTFFIKDKPREPKLVKGGATFFSFLGYWKESPALYRKVIIGFLAFALFNSSDLFLILKLKESGLNDTWVIGTYILYNLVYALFALPLGVLADRIGLKKMYIIGLVMFALVYFGMSMQAESWVYIVLFASYGIYAAATEGIAKAWISNIAEKKDTATAIGLYSGFQSICALLASSLTGLMWYAFGSGVAFMVTAIMAIGVVGYFLAFVTRPVQAVR
ncbi:MAG: MFS transporter [Saprospiraceae bacterium]|nr:MFS transporter [Candidatus Opimibacter skivensis]